MATLQSELDLVKQIALATTQEQLKWHRSDAERTNKSKYQAAPNKDGDFLILECDDDVTGRKLRLKLVSAESEGVISASTLSLGSDQKPEDWLLYAELNSLYKLVDSSTLPSQSLHKVEAFERFLKTLS